MNIFHGRRDDTLNPAHHHLTIVDALREVALRAERAGVVVIIERSTLPLATQASTCPYEGYEIVEAVDSENVKLLFDVYHKQISVGNVIKNIRNHVT